VPPDAILFLTSAPAIRMVHTYYLSPKGQHGEFAYSFPMQLPCILNRSVQEPGDYHLVPLLATNFDPEMVVVLVKSIHPPPHIGVILLHYVRLGDLQVPLVHPGVPGAGAEGLNGQDVTDHCHRGIVIPSVNDLRLILQDYSLMVTPFFLFELLHSGEWGVSFQPVLADGASVQEVPCSHLPSVS
jgi:hypothetical protein